MAPVSRFLLAGIPLALAACADLDPFDPWPQTIERGARTASQDRECVFKSRTYRPTPGDKAPYDAVIPPTYDTPSQVPSYCKELGN